MELTYAALLKRALLAGLAAGVLFALYALVVAEPTIDRAITIEEAMTSAEGGHGHADEPLFTRGEQVGGGMLAGVLFAAMVSAIFATVYASVRHRISGDSDFRRVLLLAAVGFSTTALFPMLKYPPNPPAVGDPDTVGERTLQYLALLVFSIVAAVLLAKLSGWLRRRFDEPIRIAAFAASTALVYGGALVVFPDSPDSISASMPASLIWEFRLQSIGGLALLWTTFALGFGWLLTRVPAATRDAVEATALAGA
jgi:predicted cobalt transporter CbtA